MGGDSENPFDQLKEALIESANKSQMPFAEALVFLISGAEIRDHLFEMAAQLEKKTDEELIGSARAYIPARAYIFPQGLSPQDSEEIMRSMSDRVRRGAELQAKRLRFLAEHVDEARVFRLGVSDISWLGFMPGGGMG